MVNKVKAIGNFLRNFKEFVATPAKLRGTSNLTLGSAIVPIAIAPIQLFSTIAAKQSRDPNNPDPSPLSEFFANLYSIGLEALMVCSAIHAYKQATLMKLIPYVILGLLNPWDLINQFKARGKAKEIRLIQKEIENLQKEIANGRSSNQDIQAIEKQLATSNSKLKILKAEWEDLNSKLNAFTYAFLSILSTTFVSNMSYMPLKKTKTGSQVAKAKSWESYLSENDGKGSIKEWFKLSGENFQKEVACIKDAFGALNPKNWTGSLWAKNPEIEERIKEFGCDKSLWGRLVSANLLRITGGAIPFLSNGANAGLRALQLGLGAAAIGTSGLNLFNTTLPNNNPLAQTLLNWGMNLGSGARVMSAISNMTLYNPLYIQNAGIAAAALNAFGGGCYGIASTAPVLGMNNNTRQTFESVWQVIGTTLLLAANGAFLISRPYERFVANRIPLRQGLQQVAA